MFVPVVPMGIRSLSSATLAVNVMLSVMASPKVVSPSTARALFIDVVPVVAPMSIAVAAPPMFNVSTVALKREAVVVVEVISALVAPFTPRSPATSAQT